MIPFASSRHGHKLIFNFFTNMPDRPKGRGRATPIYVEKCCRKTVGYFGMVPFALSRQLSKLNLLQPIICP